VLFRLKDFEEADHVAVFDLLEQVDLLEDFLLAELVIHE
jgi:hypothetical protein